MPPPSRFLALSRRAWLGLPAALWLAGCATPLPPLQRHRLPADPAEAADAMDTAEAAEAAARVPAPADAAGPEVWQLLPLRLPAYLERDRLLRAAGADGLHWLEDQRWAEPLREAVPRLLRLDLARLRGMGSVWQAPLPPGVVAQRQLQLELLALEPAADGRTLRLQAQWWLVDPAGRRAPVAQGVQLHTPVAAAADARALVAAHRRLLWRLARAIAGP